MWSELGSAGVGFVVGVVTTLAVLRIVAGILPPIRRRLDDEPPDRPDVR